MKQKTHSGAKKRLRLKGNGKVKRRQANVRHQLVSKKAKRKRHLNGRKETHTANEYQIERMLVL